MVVSAAVILVSVVFLAWTANVPPPEDVPKDDLVETPLTNPTELAMLKLQARILIGVKNFDQRAALSNLNDLKQTVSHPHSKLALAIVHAFINGPENGGEATGLDLLEEAEKEGANPEWVGLVRNGIENGISEENRERLEAPLGWFASLIRPRGDPNPEFESDILSESMKIFRFLVVFGLLGLLAFMTGSVLLILFSILRVNGKVTMRYCPDESPRLKHLFLESFAVYIGVMTLGHILGGLFSPKIAIAAYVVSFVLAAIWPVLRGSPLGESFRLMGFNKGCGVFREIAAGIAGYLGILVIAAVVLTVTLIVIGAYHWFAGDGTPPGETSAAHPIVGMLDSEKSSIGRILLLLFAAVVAPLFEETMFRGALFRFFRHRWGFWLSAVIGGVIFAAIHPQGIIAVPALASMGVGFCLLREWRDSLIAPMTAHALNNGVIVMLLLLVIS